MVYNQIEYAISEKLFVGETYKNKTSWWQPIRIENGNIVMLWGDCGNENRPEDLTIWSVEKWQSHVSENGDGLFKKVGMWQFTPANNPAYECILYAHRYPEAAGRQLHKLKKDNSKLLDAMQAMLYILQDAEDGEKIFNLHLQRKVKTLVERTLEEMT